MRKLRLFAWLLVLAAVAAGAVAFVRFRPLPVAVAGIERGVPVEVFGLGTVEARVLSKLAFELSGTVDALTADAGDTVRRGEALARIDGGVQEARLAKAEAGLDRARAELRTVGAKAGRARVIVTQREQINTRRQTLLQRATVSVEAAQDAEAELAIAQADLRLANSEVEVAEAALRDAQAQRAMEAALLDRHALLAPYDGLVVARHRELGSVVNPGEAVFTLVDPRTVWALAYVDEGAAGALAVGQPARVRLRSLPGAGFDGRIVRIDIESDRVSEERRVYVKCEACPPDFHLGEQAEVTVTVDEIAAGVLVPETAVTGHGGAVGLVWTVEGGRLARREVAFGRRLLDGRIEIVSGLPEGARVVTELRPGLREGRAATVEEEERP